MLLPFAIIWEPECGSRARWITAKKCWFSVGLFELTDERRVDSCNRVVRSLQEEFGDTVILLQYFTENCRIVLNCQSLNLYILINICNLRSLVRDALDWLCSPWGSICQWFSWADISWKTSISRMKPWRFGGTLEVDNRCMMSERSFWLLNASLKPFGRSLFWNRSSFCSCVLRVSEKEDLEWDCSSA